MRDTVSTKCGLVWMDSIPSRLFLRELKLIKYYKVNNSKFYGLKCKYSDRLLNPLTEYCRHYCGQLTNSYKVSED